MIDTKIKKMDELTQFIKDNKVEKFKKEEFKKYLKKFGDIRQEYKPNKHDVTGNVG